MFLSRETRLEGVDVKELKQLLFSCCRPAGHPEPGRPRSAGEGLERRLPPGGQAEEVLRVLPPIG